MTMSEAKLDLDAIRKSAEASLQGQSCGKFEMVALELVREVERLRRELAEARALAERCHKRSKNLWRDPDYRRDGQAIHAWSER